MLRRANFPWVEKTSQPSFYTTGQEEPCAPFLSTFRSFCFCFLKRLLSFTFSNQARPFAALLSLSIRSRAGVRMTRCLLDSSAAGSGFSAGGGLRASAPGSLRPNP
eukprot:6492142-Amphidinium_carterae.1